MFCLIYSNNLVKFVNENDITIIFIYINTFKIKNEICQNFAKHFSYLQKQVKWITKIRIAIFQLQYDIKPLQYGKFQGLFVFSRNDHLMAISLINLIFQSISRTLFEIPITPKVKYFSSNTISQRQSIEVSQVYNTTNYYKNALNP